MNQKHPQANTVVAIRRRAPAAEDDDVIEGSRIVRLDPLLNAVFDLMLGDRSSTERDTDVSAA